MADAASHTEASRALISIMQPLMPSPGRLPAGMDGSTEELGEFFSLRRPQHVFDGLSSGCESVMKGAAGGLAFGLSAPVLGAVAGGPAGFAGGCVAGLAGAVLLPLVGLTAGLVQVVRGLAATPEAVSEPFAGKRWDTVSRSWVAEDLDAEALATPATDADVLEASEARRARGSEAAPGDAFGSARSVADTKLYDVLGVSPNATAADIKRAYFARARVLHPDKNPGDATAAASFQELGAAYQVLCSADTRRKYDEAGEAALAGVPLLDAQMFFNLLFGSDAFSHLVGRLELATAAAAGFGLSRSEAKEVQRRRVSRLAVRLAALLSGWVSCESDAQKAAVRASLASEVAALSSVSFGVEMLHAVGWCYVNAAQQFGGSPLASPGWEGAFSPAPAMGLVAAAEHSAHSLAAQFKLGCAGVEAVMAVRALAASADDIQTAASAAASAAPFGSGGAAAASAQRAAAAAAANNPAVAAAMGAALPSFLAALWAHTAMDIDSTVHAAAAKALWDRAAHVGPTVLRARAAALLEIGEALRAARPAGAAKPATELVEAALKGALGAAHDDEHRRDGA